MPHFPELHTNRLLLRRFTENDLENVFKGLSHPKVTQYYGVSYPTMEATKTQMQFFEDLERNGTGLWWAICDRRDHTFFGAAGYSSLSKEHQKAELGYWLLPDFWKMGIINEALPQVCSYGFRQLGLHRIEALVETENESSQNALQKLGFVREGTMRDCEIKNGKFISLDIYSRLNSTTDHF